jgi:hypothetical protein
LYIINSILSEIYLILSDLDPWSFGLSASTPADFSYNLDRKNIKLYEKSAGAEAVRPKLHGSKSKECQIANISLIWIRGASAYRPPHPPTFRITLTEKNIKLYEKSAGAEAVRPKLHGSKSKECQIANISLIWIRGAST